MQDLLPRLAEIRPPDLYATLYTEFQQDLIRLAEPLQSLVYTATRVRNNPKRQRQVNSNYERVYRLATIAETQAHIMSLERCEGLSSQIGGGALVLRSFPAG